MTSRKSKWSDEDRRAFADHNILRAQTIPNKKRKRNREECRRKKLWE